MRIIIGLAIGIVIGWYLKDKINWKILLNKAS